MGDIGVPELLIVLAIIIILFGPARLSGLGQSLGQSIRSFRNELRRSDEQPSATKEQQS